jgi:glycosyltransferase involved in cell wall biosynthesis
VLGSSYSQAVEELVQDDWNGWTFRTDEASEVLQAIDRCMTVPLDRLEEMRERARSTALRLTSEEMARRIRDVVDNVAATAGIGSRSE